MALSVLERSGSNPDVWGRKRVNVVRVTFDDSYPAGGEAFDPKSYGVPDPIFVSVENRINGYEVKYDPTNKKLRVFEANGGGAAALVATPINGTTAGAHVVTGISPDDTLVAVLHFSTAAAIATLDANLVSEFTISDDDEIDNTGGTDTTDDRLLVLYSDASAAEASSAEVAAATDLDTLVADVLIVGY